MLVLVLLCTTLSCILDLSVLASDQCFCHLDGNIDDCECTVGTVDHFNNKLLYPKLNPLLQRDYFKYFSYNAKKPCPFWSSSKSGREVCTDAFCQVKACPQDKLPGGLKTKYAMKPQVECDHDNLNLTISTSARKDFESWRNHDSSQSRFCDIEEDFCPDCDYVDLTLNPERFTGFSGKASRQIWKAIYQENCFWHSTQASRDKPSIGSFTSALENMCLEERVFFRAISGLHTSITVHLTVKFPVSRMTAGGPAAWLAVLKDQYEPNMEEFVQRFDPDTTNGQGPIWLKNLYFVYLLELRALSKAATYLRKQAFFTDNPAEDPATRQDVVNLLDLINTFPNHFDETALFTSPKFRLKDEFKDHFLNISRIMDCVGCDKCKLWGKLQITGLGTALKILFSQVSFNNHLPPPEFQLTRNEIVALFNGFGRIATSINQLEKFRLLMHHH